MSLLFSLRRSVFLNEVDVEGWLLHDTGQNLSVQALEARA